MKISKNKRGSNSFEMLSQLAIAIAGFAIVLVVAFLVMSNGLEQIADNEGLDQANASTWSTTYNATVELTNETQTIVPWLGLVILVSVALVIFLMVKKFKTS